MMMAMTMPPAVETILGGRLCGRRVRCDALRGFDACFGFGDGCVAGEKRSASLRRDGLVRVNRRSCRLVAWRRSTLAIDGMVVVEGLCDGDLGATAVLKLQGCGRWRPAWNGGTKRWQMSLARCDADDDRGGGGGAAARVGRRDAFGSSSMGPAYLAARPRRLFPVSTALVPLVNLGWGDGEYRYSSWVLGTHAKGLKPARIGGMFLSCSCFDDCWRMTAEDSFLFPRLLRFLALQSVPALTVRACLEGIGSTEVPR